MVDWIKLIKLCEIVGPAASIHAQRSSGIDAGGFS